MVALTIRNFLIAAGCAAVTLTSGLANAGVLNFSESTSQTLAGGATLNSTLTGSWTTSFPITLGPGGVSPDGSFTKSDLSDFVVDVEFDIIFLGVSDVFKAKYHYGIGGLTAWNVTISGGAPVAYNWLTDQVAPTYENIPAFIDPTNLPTSGFLELTSVLVADGLDNTITLHTFGGQNGDNFLAATFVPEGNLTFDNPAPEPATLALFGMGIVGLAVSRRQL